MDPVPDPLLLRKSGSAGNRTRNWACRSTNFQNDTEKPFSTEAGNFLFSEESSVLKWPLNQLLQRNVWYNCSLRPQIWRIPFVVFLCMYTTWNFTFQTLAGYFVYFSTVYQQSIHPNPKHTPLITLRYLYIAPTKPFHIARLQDGHWFSCRKVGAASKCEAKSLAFILRSCIR